MAIDKETVRRALADVPHLYRSPGGAVAVLQNGELVQEMTWGYADMEERVPMTPQTAFPICSISKQMVCALLVDLVSSPPAEVAAKGDVRTQLDDKLAELLPCDLAKEGLTLEHLHDNASGIRDYWALTTLWGAEPEGRFLLREHGALARSHLRELHFAPGTEYSYANTNFHIIGCLIEEVTGQPLGGLLAERVFAPAGMATAVLREDTAKKISSVGYEGDVERGFVRATNRIEWAGDAGIVATLADMEAYEAFFDRHWTQQTSAWYQAAAQPKPYKNGRQARYRLGLRHDTIAGMATIGHGGAIRGYRLNRTYLPEKRLSVVVLLNHETDAGAVAKHIIQKVLGLSQHEPASAVAHEDWVGSFLDEETQLSVGVTKNDKGPGGLRVHYAVLPETVALESATSGRSAAMTAKIEGRSLVIDRVGENRTINARRISSTNKKPSSAFVGKYYCADVDSTLECSSSGDTLYGTFSGFLGNGPMMLMRYIGENVWLLSNPRGMDAPAPGNWTLVFHDREEGSSVTVGCWLARKLKFEKVK